jgi:hypothetical protein
MQFYNSKQNYGSIYRSTGSDVGVEFDQKKCWDSTESHFICLDKFNEVYGKF